MLSQGSFEDLSYLIMLFCSARLEEFDITWMLVDCSHLSFDITTKIVRNT